MTTAASSVTESIKQDPLHEFILNPVYLTLALTVLGIFIAGYLTWLMYIKLSKKDLFKFKMFEGHFASFGSAVGYFLQYGLLFPIYSFIWFIAFVVCIYYMSANYPLSVIMFIGVILVGVVRVFAYVSERCAEDFAKLIPLTFLAMILINPSFVTAAVSSWQPLVAGIISVEALRYLIFIVGLEFILRSGYLIKLKLSGETVEDDEPPKKRKKKDEKADAES